MTAIDMLRALRAAGFGCRLDGDRLMVSPSARITDDWRQSIVEHRDGLVALLSPPAWDAAEAERLLGQVRSATASAEVEYQAGRMSEVKRNVMRLWAEVCEGYDRDHELEAQRGWDALQLLRAAARPVLSPTAH